LGLHLPKKEAVKKVLQLAPSCTINSIAHFTSQRDLGFHQFIFIHLPQTDPGALETFSNTVAFVSLPKNIILYAVWSLFLCHPQSSNTHKKHTTHISFLLPFSLLSFYHSVYLHIAKISMPHNCLKHSFAISLTDVDLYVHFSDSSEQPTAFIGFQSRVISFGFNLCRLHCTPLRLIITKRRLIAIHIGKQNIV